MFCWDFREMWIDDPSHCKIWWRWFDNFSWVSSIVLSLVILNFWGRGGQQKQLGNGDIQRSRLRRPISKIRMILLMDAKIWMTSLIIMFAMHPICVQDSIFKMSSESPGHSWFYIPIFQPQHNTCNWNTDCVWNICFLNHLIFMEVHKFTVLVQYILRRQRSGSILAQVMACCLLAPSHYLNQCWLIIILSRYLPYDMMSIQNPFILVSIQS